MKSRSALLILLSLTFALRLGYALRLPRHPIQPDAYAIDHLAWHLATHHQYGIEHPTAGRPPLYPFFLASIYTVAGHSYGRALAVQSALGTLAVLLFFLIALRLWPNPAAPWLSAGLAAVYPFFIYYEATFLSESIQPLLVVLAFWTFLRWKEKRDSVPRALACGAAFAALTLARAVFLLSFAAILAMEAVLSFRRPGTARAFRAWTGAGLLFAGIVGAWGLRNRKELGRFTLDSHGGAVLYECVVWYDAVKQGWYAENFDRDPIRQKAALMPEIEADDYFRSHVRDFIRNHPRRFLRQALANVVDFWRFYPRQDIRFREGSRFITVISLLTEPFLLIVGTFGVWITRKRWELLYPAYATIFCVAALHILSTAQMRYRLPLMPFFIIWVAPVVLRRS